MDEPIAQPNRSRAPLFLALGAIGAILVSLFYIGFVRRSNAIDGTGLLANATPTGTPDADYTIPKDNPDRLDVLILGIRGENDPNAETGGALLTDSIQILSYDQTTKKSAIISIPRDLYITVTDGKKEKINAAYEYGAYHSPNGLRFIQDRMSRVTGVYIDKVVIFDFSSFKTIIDALGGIDVVLEKPFTETQQWGYEFSLPAGKNHLNGQSALYYARSRYSTSDFDRSRRQQQIMFAIKEKLVALDFFADPVKSFSIMNLIRSNIKTDVGVWDLKQFLNLASETDFVSLKRYVISDENLLKVDKGPQNSYILVPKTGNLTEVKKIFQEIID
ncbi:MAG: hypothetical protein A3C88_00195 [Candidatus Yanofskybacteria bacterium RIFCSPHIGHO2_02_FULL_50_12]|uniref:Cell envelope-related transcriptional attenuator domain-containing protein n=1 Tax=Candidatus Yanofskybacteria bacterium RIFCSPHIGHO2_02_FULL_50_12 TaxID=1802685 RepID=A0A1F8FUC6_9BACT|nr:MAG: hypothetical protein A3C88_00195 [Candidatus Yanofskybacteria bacterium RIFCSPHIGHO2_02_FULL_50_12]